jgi:hypothetical protein
MVKKGKVIAFQNDSGSISCKTADEFAKNFSKYADSLINFEWKRPQDEVSIPGENQYKMATIASMKTGNGFKIKKPTEPVTEENNSDPGRIKIFPQTKPKTPGSSE